MCGILGKLSNRLFSDKEVAEFTASNSLMSHRGPDFSSVHRVSDKLLFGHNRLSVIDLDEKSNQPFSKNGRDALVFNGEIYNYKEVRNALIKKGHSFISDGDTEVLYEGFKTYGIPFLSEINGMFAFAFWSADEEKLYLVRDRLGIKPLYLHKSDSHISFSSEIRPLLSASTKKWVDSNLAEWLFYQSNPSHTTFFEDITLLKPGTCLQIDSTFSQNHISYFDLKSSYTSSQKGDEDSVRKLVLDSVESRLVADVPLGAFLSGGIDSSIVVASMRKVYSGEIRTFSIGFDNPDFDERSYAKLVSEKHQTNHTELVYSSAQILDLIPKAVDSLDYPTGDAINTWLVSKATKEAGITVALSGLGGDELFGGYPSFSRNASPIMNQNWIQSGLSLFPNSFINRNRSLSKLKLIHDLKKSAFSQVASSRAVFLPQEIKRLSNSVFLPFHKDMNTSVSYEELIQYTIPLLIRDTDQTSMHHALEVRVPLLDYKLVNYMASLKDSYRFNSKQQFPKELLVNSFKDDLPSQVYSRKKKGFVLPFDLWLKNELKNYTKESLFDSPLSSLLSGSEIQKMWAQFLKGNPSIKWSQIWSLAVLGRWMQNNRLHH